MFERTVTPPEKPPFRDPRCPKFTFIDLYAGIGGTRLALQRAGGRCVFASERDKFARKTYEANFGEEPKGAIEFFTPSEIPAHDVLVAGFPCQPFSIAGVSKKKALGRPHGFSDEQGMAFHRISEILCKKEPPAFLLENVRHLQTHDRGNTMRVILGELDRLGYEVQPALIDASLVVPQHRERLYLVGFKKQLGIRFVYPGISPRRVKLSDILEAEVEDRYTLSDKLWRYLQDYAKKHRAAGNGFGYGLADLDGTTRTLSARYYKDGAEILVPQPASNPRRLIPRECARLMGFPEKFMIPVSDRQAYQQFGNSVAVPIVEKIARKMARALVPKLAPQ